jgi:hypothetical protein
MQISLSFFVLFISLSAIAECRFKKHVTKIFSLSGATSIALRDYGMLKNRVVKGISVFNPIGSDEFSGKRYPGGIFLAPGVFQEFSGGVIFYDESRELERILSPMSSIQGIEIKTRNLTPLEVSKYVKEKLKPFLESCEKEESVFLLKTKSLEEKLLNFIPSQKTEVFYLGSIFERHPPEMLMVNDGVVKLLVDKKKIRTYTSPLAYVSWSTKLMQNLPADTLHIGIIDSGEKKTIKFIKKENKVDLTYPGALVPGLSQLEAWVYLQERLNAAL